MGVIKIHAGDFLKSGLTTGTNRFWSVFGRSHFQLLTKEHPIGAVLGGRGTEVTFVATFKDGRRLLESGPKFMRAGPGGV